MNQKTVGLAIAITGLILFVVVLMLKANVDSHIDEIIVSQGGSCYLDDGTCLHDMQDNTLFIVGWVLAGILIVFGLYLTFIDKTQERLVHHQKVVSSALRDAKRIEAKKEAFIAFLSAFSNEEQRVLKVIHEESGITQSTLRFKTNMSKASLSSLLKNLEEREIISKKPKGKTNSVFLVKRF